MVVITLDIFLEANKFERLLWVLLTLMGFALASLMLKDAIIEWMDFPTRNIVNLIWL